MSGIVGSKFNHRGSGLVSSLGTDGQHMLSSGAGKKHVFETVASASYDDNKIQTNIALLGFKTAVNGSLAKYNLVDQIIDEFEDASGVDTSASTNETLTEGTYFGGTLGYPTGGTITTPISGYRQHAFTANGSLSVSVTGNVGIMVVAGGASGGSDMAGGG